MRAVTRVPAQGGERGVMLIEALVAILIFSIGILAVVGMQAIAIKDVTSAKYRSEATQAASRSAVVAGDSGLKPCRAICGERTAHSFSRT